LGLPLQRLHTKNICGQCKPELYFILGADKCQALFEKIIDINHFYAYTCDVLSKDVDKIYLSANYWRYIENDVK